MGGEGGEDEDEEVMSAPLRGWGPTDGGGGEGGEGGEGDEDEEVTPRALCSR